MARKILDKISSAGDRLGAIEVFKQGNQDINNLRYKFDQGARANRFMVDMRCPNLGIQLEGVRCSNATLPGRQLEVEEFSEYGPLRKMPTNISMDGGEATFSFLCDSSFADRFLVEAWQDVIYASNKGDRVGSSLTPYFNYYYDYVGEIEVAVLNQRDNKTLVYTLHEAYPLSYAAMDLAYESSDEIMKFEVTMAFRTFSTEYKESPMTLTDILNKGSRALGAFDQLLGVAGKDSRALNKIQDRVRSLGGFTGGFGI